ncbi:MAG: hypothetical protein JSS09_04005, partial [Verrucomicrobia bacterium]|nr:hypothetical protein [Verrucomicrobiota bacterium]
MLAGSIEPGIEGCLVHINPRSHVLGLELEIEPILMKKNELPPLLKGAFTYKWESLPSYLTFFQKMGFSLPEYNLPLIEGNAKLQIIYDTKALKTQLHIESPEFIYEKNIIGKMNCDLYYKENLWILESCEVGPYFFSGKMKKKEAKWVLEGLCFKSLETKVLAEGTYDQALGEINLPNIFFSKETLGTQIESKGSFKGVFSEEKGVSGRGVLEKLIFKQDLYVFSAKKGMTFTGCSKEGINLEKSQWDCIDFNQKQSLGKINIQNLSYLFDEQRLLLGGAIMKLSKEGIVFFQKKTNYKELLSVGEDKEIIIKMDAEIAPDYKKMSGNIENGSLNLLGFALDVKNIQILQEKEKLYLSCQSLLQKKPIWIGWQSRIDQNVLGVLTFKEDIKDTGLCVQIEKRKDKPFNILSAEGSFFGLDLKIQKVDSSEKNSLSYNTQMKVDFAKLSILLPAKSKEIIQKLALGGGYGFMGAVLIDPSCFRLVSCVGKVEAEEFICLGKKMHSLKAKVSFAKDVFSLQDLTLEDNLGLLTIKTIEARSHPQTGQVFVTAPLIHVKDFSPSSLTKADEQGTLIKNISLYQVKGILQDINSFEATGALNFVKSIKKEFSFWDIPLNLMKDFGLDTGLLSPVVGEAEFILSQGRLYFTALKNMYSEGERS